MRQWQIWVDRGGTFTDIVAKKPDGTLVTHKLLSENPEKYSDAAVQGIRDLLELTKNESIPKDLIDAVKMGTTVATNALLERKGDRTLYVTTSGFGDSLRIGYQNRPDLFARHIVLPEMLYEEVLEVPERVSAQGDIILPLNTEIARTGMQNAFNRGIRGVAIAFMHGYRYHQHEEQIAEIARKIGFTQVSTSHRVSPLMKLISRGDTTTVDAYLSPILRRYVTEVADQLGAINGNGPQLLFMQSNGGLTDATLFQGKDAILSGPAGGVVGMVKSAAVAGLTKLIGFDMGGTSTDVTHYSGEYERSFETVVAGIRMRAPMMHIHTVAAGGGSILSFDGTRFRVGPESAGATPGPACYRRGGPLTVTDCNIMLGKIQPNYFPSVFGPDGTDCLDRQTVQNGFQEMCTTIALESGAEDLTPETVAEGFLKIAVENMANAIKKISVQRGYDVTEYTLNSFGGAGGQHACLVADALGMEQVFLHPYNGVLSAYGMGLADIRALRELQLEFPLDANAPNQIKSASISLEKVTTQEVIDQGVEPGRIDVLTKVHLRYEGTDTPLFIDFGSYKQMLASFEQSHKQRFGFIAKDRSLIVEALSVEAVGSTETVPDLPLETSDTASPLKPTDNVDMYCNGTMGKTPLYLREQLIVGSTITGPAIIVESTGTVVVEEGWSAKVNHFSHLILKRYKKRTTAVAIGTSADPVMLEVFNNLFMSIAEQMGATLANTAYSVNIKERLDFSCALFAPNGNLVANAPHVPVHLGSMGESIKTVIRENAGTMKAGDVYMLNAPYNGGTHLPDVTVITPVFSQNSSKILFYVASRGHHADIGGRTPGSSPPDSQHIDEEGVLIDNFKLVDQGELLEQQTRKLLSSGPYPCRNIDQNMADLSAQIAANETGVRELRNMVDHFGLEMVHSYMDHVQNNAEESVRRVITLLEDCDFIYPMDGNQQIQVSISVDKENREATIDFTGTSPQQTGNYNAPTAVCKAAVLYVFRTLVADNIPLNEGCMKPLNLVIPPRTMISPEYPAAVISGNTEVSQAITDALFGALGLLASSQGTMNNFVYGNNEVQNYETICGGTGAGPDHPGTSGVHSHMTNTRMTDPEVVEYRFPVRVESFGLRHQSGGSGRYSGGDGVVRKIRFLAPMTATILSSHRETVPYGLQGGAPGKRGENIVIRSNDNSTKIRGNDEISMSTNDIFIIKTPGGGGFGSSGIPA